MGEEPIHPDAKRPAAHVTTRPRRWCLALVLVVSPLGGSVLAIDYGAEIRPILSDNCFHCHGPDDASREAGFRLDVRDDAIDAGAIVPGEPASSSFIERIDDEDPDLIMPPRSHKKLSEG